MTLKAETALLGGRALRYRVRRSKRTRRIGVQVSRSEGVMVVLPWRCKLDVVPEILADMGDWLTLKADQFDAWDGPEIKQYATGSGIRILGQIRRLELVGLPTGRQRYSASLSDDTLRLEVPPIDIFDPRPVLEKYLRRIAGETLRSRVADWAERIELHPRRVIVGERTTRWGSCSRRGTLSFCYRLVMAPPEVIDAVVAHEICHLAHLNHSKRFYALLDRVCPGHREAMDWLRVHHEDLLL